MPCRGVKDDTEQQPLRCRQEEKILLRALCGPWARCARGGQGSADAAVSQLFSSTRFSILQLLYDIFIGKQRSTRAPLINYGLRWPLAEFSFLRALEKPRVDALLGACNTHFDPVATGIGEKFLYIVFLSADDMFIYGILCSFSLKSCFAYEKEKWNWHLFAFWNKWACLKYISLQWSGIKVTDFHKICDFKFKKIKNYFIFKHF